MIVGNSGINTNSMEENIHSSSYKQASSEALQKPSVNEKPAIENKLGASKEGSSEQDLEGKKKALLQILQKEDNKIQVKNNSLEFAMHDETNQIMVKVIDNNTHEVVKEIPSQKVLDMIAKMMEFAGLFVDEKR